MFTAHQNGMTAVMEIVRRRGVYYRYVELVYAPSGIQVWDAHSSQWVNVGIDSQGSPDPDWLRKWLASF